MIFFEGFRAPERRIETAMHIFRRHRILLCFFVVLVFCSVMVIQSFRARQARHIEVREALILLHARGYTNEAVRLYNRLLKDMPELSDKNLIDDFQRTRMLVDPSLNHPENPVWRYHWVVSNELEKRSESSLVRARRLADEK